jgi:AraC-like DNA-binding protein
MDIFDYRLPSPHLIEFVRLFQIVGAKFPSSMVNLPVKAYWPRAENCLSFFPKDPEKIEYGFDGKLVESPRSRIYGQHSIATNRHVGRDFMVFQVVFQPGALYRLTGIPAHLLSNNIVDAEAIFSSEIKRVNERLSYTSNYGQMILIIEDFIYFLIRKSKKVNLPIDKVSHLMLHNPGKYSLDWLADQACLCQRQFYRQFVEREGISPKMYARISRFEKVMKQKNAQPNKDWLSIALELGYHDYPHLVRDFKEFTNMTPRAFYNEEIKSPERHFGISETY